MSASSPSAACDGRVWWCGRGWAAERDSLRCACPRAAAATTTAAAAAAAARRRKTGAQSFAAVDIKVPGAGVVVRPCATRLGSLAGSVSRRGSERAIISWGSWPRNTPGNLASESQSCCRLPETAVTFALVAQLCQSVARLAPSAWSVSWAKVEVAVEVQGRRHPSTSWAGCPIPNTALRYATHTRPLHQLTARPPRFYSPALSPY